MIRLMSDYTDHLTKVWLCVGVGEGHMSNSARVHFPNIQITRGKCSSNRRRRGSSGGGGRSGRRRI